MQFLVSKKISKIIRLILIHIHNYRRKTNTYCLISKGADGSSPFSNGQPVYSIPFVVGNCSLLNELFLTRPFKTKYPSLNIPSHLRL